MTNFSIFHFHNTFCRYYRIKFGKTLNVKTVVPQCFSFSSVDYCRHIIFKRFDQASSVAHWMSVGEDESLYNEVEYLGTDAGEAQAWEYLYSEIPCPGEPEQGRLKGGS